jgi:hypothetical protein
LLSLFHLHIPPLGTILGASIIPPDHHFLFIHYLFFPFYRGTSTSTHHWSITLILSSPPHPLLTPTVHGHTKTSSPYCPIYTRAKPSWDYWMSRHPTQNQKYLIIKKKFHPLCTPLGPKEGTTAGPSPRRRLLCFLEKDANWDIKHRVSTENFTTFRLTQRASDARAARAQGTDAGESTMIPAECWRLRPFPFVEPSRAPDGRGNSRMWAVSGWAPSPSQPLSVLDFWYKRKGKESNPQFIYRVFQSS